MESFGKKDLNTGPFTLITTGQKDSCREDDEKNDQNTVLPSSAGTLAVVVES